MSTITDPTRIALGQFVRDRRLDLGYTQDELADRSGIGQETISSIERGAGSFPRLKTLSKLAQGLSVDLGVLLEILEVQRVVRTASEADDGEEPEAVPAPAVTPPPVVPEPDPQPPAVPSQADFVSRNAIAWASSQLAQAFPTLSQEDAVAVAHLVLHLLGRNSER